MRTENEPAGRAAVPSSAPVVSRPLRTAGLVGLSLHLATVLWFVLRPLPVTWVYDTNLSPFGSVRRALAEGGGAALWRVACELLLLAPLGVLLPLAGGRARAPWLPSFLRVAGLSAVLATALEFLASSVPGHVLDVDHILLGVLGACSVHLAVVPAGRALLRRHAVRVRVPAPARPRPPVQAPAPPPVPGARPAPLPVYGRPAPRAR
ncbi:VanZ family protein [Kitasatospora sp. NBC_00315]|uniref:VanZ family protein n=1 Tax=Kitasatospora sp. NBC_00315 TaxID=2975963 RepID=UPI003252170E